MFPYSFSHSPKFLRNTMLVFYFLGKFGTCFFEVPNLHTLPFKNSYSCAVPVWVEPRKFLSVQVFVRTLVNGAINKARARWKKVALPSNPLYCFLFSRGVKLCIVTRKGEIRRLKVQQSPLIFDAFLPSFHWPQDFATNNILLMYNCSRAFV